MNKYCMIEVAFNNIEEVNKVIDVLLSKKFVVSTHIIESNSSWNWKNKRGNRSVKRNVEFYNLDAIISVGYRVNSLRATQFRRQTTNILKTFTIQGYVLDKERTKNGSFIDKDYFEKLLEEIREIRLSERRFYQKVTDVYATSIDYDPKSPISIGFFKRVQNKMCYAVSKQTAAEIILKQVILQK